MRCLHLTCLFVALAAGGLALTGCGTTGVESPFGPFPGTSPADPVPSFAPEEIVGRWGIASYQRDADRARTEAAARKACGKPYTIGKGPNGGVMMHLADQTAAQELRVKGTPQNKTFIGPAGEAGGIQDREVVSFDGRVLVLRYVDPDAANRYGTMVYVRCGPRA